MKSQFIFNIIVDRFLFFVLFISPSFLFSQIPFPNINNVPIYSSSPVDQYARDPKKFQQQQQMRAMEMIKAEKESKQKQDEELRKILREEEYRKQFDLLRSKPVDSLKLKEYNHLKQSYRLVNQQSEDFTRDGKYFSQLKMN